MKKVLIVCLGNICRSPTAEAVLRSRAKALGVNVKVDSAGTIGYHQGNPPDSRSKKTQKPTKFLTFSEFMISTC